MKRSKHAIVRAGDTVGHATKAKPSRSARKAKNRMARASRKANRR